MAAVLYLLIQQGDGARFPVKATYRPEGQMLPTIQRQGWLLWDDALQTRLLQASRAPLRYGQCLGEALFQDWLKELWFTIRGRESHPFRVLLAQEAQSLTSIHWERLAAPGPSTGQWLPLALDQTIQFAHYLPRQAERSFPVLTPRDLRALVVVANPPRHNRFQLSPFAAANLAAQLQHALTPIPTDHLSTEAGALGMPTLDALCGRLAATNYPILHLVAHGQYRPGIKQSYLYLLDAQGEVAPIPLPDLIHRLGQLNRLPHFIFLSVCDSAQPDAEVNSSGIAQPLVQVLGIPAVIAMRETISQTTANALSPSFYNRLHQHGDVSQALNEAIVPLAAAPDITVPALYTCLEQPSLFTTNMRPLTGPDVAYGLRRLQNELITRAPTCQDKWQRLETLLHPYVTTPTTQLSPTAQQAWQSGLEQLDTLCQEIFDLSFAAAALDYPLPHYDARCPFPGLAAFTGTESSFYFGRETLIQALLIRLKTVPFLALVGASGCGKSSLARAGLLPAWQREMPELKICLFTPGATPHNTLQTQLATIDEGTQAVLVVDQFEELFTQCQDEAERGRFLDLLLTQRPHHAILLTMRADFWGECAPYPALRQHMQAHQELIAPLTITELPTVLERQAAATGLRLENGLIEQLIQDVAGEPGAMPLLQHALRELWERRRGRNLTLTAYQNIGGAQKAIAQTAEKLFLQVTPTEQTQLRDLFLRLIRLDLETNPGTEPRDTRQHILLSESVPLDGTATGIRSLVARLASARLVVTDYDAAADQESVQIIHEALIRYWPRLQNWLAEDRTLLQLRQGIRQAAREWQAAPPEQQASLLLHRGVRLTEIRQWQTTQRLQVNQQEQAYLEACWQQQLEIEAQLRRQLYLEQRARRLAWGLVMGAVMIILVLAGVLLYPEYLRHRAVTLHDPATIPGGTALIGAAEPTAPGEERPAWTTPVSAFFLDRYEVNNQQYNLCIRARHCTAPLKSTTFQDETAQDLPVIGVSGVQAAAYCAWVRGRLPTEVEWEYAARGPQNALRLWPWGDFPVTPDTDHANLLTHETAVLLPVRALSEGATPDTNLFHLVGNAWEWTASYYTNYPEQIVWNGEPGDLRIGDSLIIRGGGFQDNSLVRITRRSSLVAQETRSDIGFRCAFD